MISPKTEISAQSRYKAYLPVYDTTTKLPATEPFEFRDRGLDADKAKPNLLKAEGIAVKKLTPRVGTEIDGIQLSQLNDAQKNELALLIAERGVVVFRNQDFKDSMFPPDPYVSALFIASEKKSACCC